MFRTKEKKAKNS